MEDQIYSLIYLHFNGLPNIFCDDVINAMSEFAIFFVDIDWLIEKMFVLQPGRFLSSLFPCEILLFFENLIVNWPVIDYVGRSLAAFLNISLKLANYSFFCTSSLSGLLFHLLSQGKLLIN